MPSNTRPDQQHFVAPLEETPLVAIDSVKTEGKPSNLWIDAWRDVRKRPMFWISSAMILLVIVVALFPDLFTQVPPNNDCQLSNSNGGPTDGHPLGFTRQGCDIYSRIIHGTSTSLAVGIIVTVLVASLGIVFGAFAGFYGGWLDGVLSRVGDIFFSIPYILAAVVVMSVFSKYANVWVISLAIGIFAWPATARVLRAEILRVKNSDFVMASTALGVSRFRILLRHVLPNAMGPILVIATINLALAVITEATLSFLGAGMPDTMPSLGTLIRIGNNYLFAGEWWIVAFPGLALASLILAINLLGDWLRDALNPKLR